MSNNKKIFLLPACFVLSTLPLIMKLYGYQAHLSSFPWFSVTDEYTDSFLFCKSFLIIIAGSISLLLLFAVWIKRKKLKLSVVWLLPTGYFLLCILSTATSVSPWHSVHGSYEQFESLFVLLAYGILSFSVYSFTNSNGDVTILRTAFMVGALLLCILGLSQFFGYDFLKTNLAHRLIAGKNGSFMVTAEPGTVYMSLYNQNYVGLYCSMSIPILGVMGFLTQNSKMKLCCGLLCAGLLVCLYGSGSKNGFLTLLLVGGLMFVLFRSIFKNYWKRTAAGITISVIILCGIGLWNGGNLFTRTLNALNIKKEEKPPIENIRTKKERIEIDYAGNTLCAELNLKNTGPENKLNIYDLHGTPIKYAIDNDDYTYILNDKRFPNFYLAPLVLGNVVNESRTIEGPLDAFLVGMDYSEWMFTVNPENGKYYYVTKVGKLDTIRNKDFRFFQGYEEIFSGRGYIWSRTLPLLKKYFWYGSGPDTFVIVYPNNDYVGRHNFGYSDALTTKPHCLYLQIAVQTGIPSLLLFLAFFLAYIYQSVKLYNKCGLNSAMSQTGLAIMAGILGFLISGITNDSTVTVSPVFWILIGLGHAVNELVANTSNPC